MNPLSSIPPAPPQARVPSSLENTVSSSPDSVKGTSASSSSPSMDVVSFSIPTQEVSHYLEQMSQIPDIRQERITHIQKALASNSYFISPEKLADKLLDELHSQPQRNRSSTAS